MSDYYDDEVENTSWKATESDWKTNLFINEKRQIFYTRDREDEPIMIGLSELEEMYRKALDTKCTYYKPFACRVISVYCAYTGSANDYVV